MKGIDKTLLKKNCVTLITLSHTPHPIQMLSVDLSTLSPFQINRSLYRSIIELINTNHIHIVLIQNASLQLLSETLPPLMQSRWNCTGNSALELFTFFKTNRFKILTDQLDSGFSVSTTIFYDNLNKSCLSLTNINDCYESFNLDEAKTSYLRLLRHYSYETDCPIIAGNFANYLAPLETSNNPQLSTTGAFFIGSDKKIIQLNRKALILGDTSTAKLIPDYGFQLCMDLEENEITRYEDWLQQHWGKRVFLKSSVMTDDKAAVTIIFSKMDVHYFRLKQQILEKLQEAHVRDIFNHGETYFCISVTKLYWSQLKALLDELILDFLINRAIEVIDKFSGQAVSTPYFFNKLFDNKRKKIVAMIFNSALSCRGYDLFQRFLLLITLITSSGNKELKELIAKSIVGACDTKLLANILDKGLLTVFSRTRLEIQPLIDEVDRIINQSPSLLPKHPYTIFNRILQTDFSADLPRTILY